MKPAKPFVLACSLLLSVPVFAQTERPFPMETVSANPAVGTVTTLPNLDAISELREHDHVVLRDVYLPGGEMIDLQLERIDLERLKYGFIVDGIERPHLLDDLDISAWKGTVLGSPNSNVSITFSREGNRGWIQRKGSLMHLMPKPDSNGDWSKGSSIFISEASLNALGSRLEGYCENDRFQDAISQLTRSNRASRSESNMPTLGFQDCGPREGKVALETDYQLFQIFNSLGAETAYIVALTATSSDRFETQANTVLTFPYVQFYTDPNDPWSTPDNGGNTSQMLGEFVQAWGYQAPGGAYFAHFMSGAALGGGLAQVGINCSFGSTFAVSGNINGDVAFPVTQNPNNWDFMVFNHELGHNFGSLHTHDFCPPLDECAPSQYFGQCQTNQVCITTGTLLSYCHQCNGGTRNITTFFHPTVASVLTYGAANCLPLYSGIESYPPTIITPDTPTEISAKITGTVTGSVDLLYRYDGGIYNSVPMVNVAGSRYKADLPPATCSDSPEFYISYTDSNCGPVTAPADGVNAPYIAFVGIAVTSFADDFNSDNGWTTQSLGATAGFWERGIPVDYGDLSAPPQSDGDGSGFAYLTDNQFQLNDVDGGGVSLLSPIFDMSADYVEISYLYYLFLTNQAGNDRIIVQASSNGYDGPWFVVAKHDTRTDYLWRSHTINMTATGITLGPNMALRISAFDAPFDDNVEAGFDGFLFRSTSCDSRDPGPYCAANANSVSSNGAQLNHVSGSPGGVLDLQITDVPNSAGILFFGSQQQDLPYGCGRLCIGGPLVRSGVFFAMGNTVNASFDTTGIASNPFNIQYWYRDLANQVPCGSDFNTSNALGF